MALLLLALFAPLLLGVLVFAIMVAAVALIPAVIIGVPIGLVRAIRNKDKTALGSKFYIRDSFNCVWAASIVPAIIILLVGLYIEEEGKNRKRQVAIAAKAAEKERQKMARYSMEMGGGYYDYSQYGSSMGMESGMSGGPPPMGGSMGMGGGMGITSTSNITVPGGQLQLQPQPVARTELPPNESKIPIVPSVDPLITFVKEANFLQGLPHKNSALAPVKMRNLTLGEAFDFVPQFSQQHWETDGRIVTLTFISTRQQDGKRTDIRMSFTPNTTRGAASRISGAAIYTNGDRLNDTDMKKFLDRMYDVLEDVLK